MTKVENVKSTVKPQSMEFDNSHVYLNTDIKEVPESERQSEKDQLEEGQSLTPMYEYTVETYEKDEFLQALQNGQVSLDTRATSIEDALLEMSEMVYA